MEFRQVVRTDTGALDGEGQGAADEWLDEWKGEGRGEGTRPT